MSKSRPLIAFLMCLAGCGDADRPTVGMAPAYQDAGSAPEKLDVAVDRGAPDHRGAPDYRGIPDLGGTADLGAMPGDTEPALAVCPPAAPARHANNSAEVRLPVELRAGGKPLRLGQEVVRADGVSEKFAQVLAFVTQPVLLQEGGRRVPVQLLYQGQAAPHGLVLLDADKPESLVLSLAAPMGSYTGLELGVGVPRPCNGGDPTRRAFPLNADSGMYWSWGAQYLFVKVEALMKNPGPAAVWDTYRLHMGMNEVYRSARLEGVLSVGQGPTGPTVVFDVDGLIRPDSPTSEPPSHVRTPAWLADHISAGAVLFFSR